MTGNFLRAAHSCVAMLPSHSGARSSAPDVDLTLEDSDVEAQPPRRFNGAASKKRPNERWLCPCGMDNDHLSHECACCDALKPTDQGANRDETTRHREDDDDDCIITAVTEPQRERAGASAQHICIISGASANNPCVVVLRSGECVEKHWLLSFISSSEKKSRGEKETRKARRQARRLRTIANLYKLLTSTCRGMPETAAHDQTTRRMMGMTLRPTPRGSARRAPGAPAVVLRQIPAILYRRARKVCRWLQERINLTLQLPS